MRIQSPVSLTLLRSCAVVTLLLVVPGSAVADTIYLKNGRVIHTATAKQMGDKVEFEQFGQTVSIPMSVVLRIERDAQVEQPSVPPASPLPAGGEPQQPESTEDGGAGEEEELPPASNPDYWSDRIRSIRDEKAEIAESIVKWRREERAFIFNGNMSTTEIRLRIEAAQARDKALDQELVDLRREARLLGVPPGWLRVREDATAS